jgi:hypothetical protein
MRTINAMLRYSITALAVCCANVIAAATAATGAHLITLQQQELDAGAMPLRSEPVVKAARAAAIERWGQQPAAKTADGKASLNGAVDELVYHALRAAVADNPAVPKVGWTLAPMYGKGKSRIPGSRFAGDSPDRIYRYAAVDSAYRYEIRGQRGGNPAQHEFSFEATASISLVTPAAVALFSKDIDVAGDGSFVVTADSTPTNGRRNHLQLPQGTHAVLIRDTLPDWSTDYNQVTVTRLDAGDTPARSADALAGKAAAIIAEAAAGTELIFRTAWRFPANEIKPFVRPSEWGVPGNIIAINRFSLQRDEALVITLVASGANYLGFQLTDPWSRSIDYWDRTSSLSDHQIKPNADGSITYVLSAKDPGIHNWLDNNGFREGLMLVRWELFPQPLAAEAVAKLVREVRKVKLRELASALPVGVVGVTAAERRQQLDTRAAGFARRVAFEGAGE